MITHYEYKNDRPACKCPLRRRPASATAARRPAAPGARLRPCPRHPVGIIGRALRSAVTLAFAVLCTAVPAGCTKELGETSASRRPLVVYLALDNDLRGELSSRLAALRAGWQPDMELWVYADTPEGASLGRMESAPEGATLRTVERYGEENSASGATLERVLRTVWRLCPSDGYGLLFFSHATGWLPAGTLGHPSGSRSVGSDHGSEIELESFSAALPEGMPLDYVVFECCLMAGAEVMLELQGRTPWVLASSAEVVAPGFRPLYERGLEVLTERTRPVPELLAAFGQSYMSHVEGLSGEYRSATLSVVHTEALPRLAGEVRRWTGGQVGDEASSPLPDGLQHFDRPGMYGDRPAAARFFDLEEWVETLAGEGAPLSAFRAALADAVVWHASTERFLGGKGSPYGGFDIHRHSGLTVYVPRGEFPELNEAYRRTAWWRATHGSGAETFRLCP